ILCRQSPQLHQLSSRCRTESECRLIRRACRSLSRVPDPQCEGEYACRSCQRVFRAEPQWTSAPAGQFKAAGCRGIYHLALARSTERCDITLAGPPAHWLTAPSRSRQREERVCEQMCFLSRL